VREALLGANQPKTTSLTAISVSVEISGFDPNRDSYSKNYTIVTAFLETVTDSLWKPLSSQTPARGERHCSLPYRVPKESDADRDGSASVTVGFRPLIAAATSAKHSTRIEAAAGLTDPASA